MPTNATIELRFDRYLDPATAVRQALVVFSGSASNAVFLEPEYDLVERVVRYRHSPGQRFLPGVLYTVELFVPAQHHPSGFRAFDGTPLAEGLVPLRFSFRTALSAAPDATPGPAPDCQDIFDIFARATPRGSMCNSRGCHRPPARMGMDLSSRGGLAKTVISRVAHETALGPRPDTPLEDPPRFGVQMPLVDPGRPGNSYLLYKLLRKSDNFDDPAGPCATRYRVALPPGQCLPPSPAESTRLQEWFVSGRPMPLARNASDHAHLEQADLRTLERWIAVGAPLDGCSGAP